jgi:UDP-glucuronate 4-epimerase
MTILVTGAAGFIGFHVSRALRARGQAVVGVDSLNSYYDPRLKEARLAELADDPGFTFQQLDIAERAALLALADRHPEIEGVIHLAAQAGVRYSLEDPFAYLEANVVGQLSVLEAARRLPNFKHLVYASSSSVYGDTTPAPFAIDAPADDPASVYAATKRAGELLARTYGNLYQLPATGLRFFTVYGPWGRPDMAYYSFTRAILEGRPIRVFNQGRLRRDFTWIEDIVAGVLAALDRVPEAPPQRLYNLGNNQPVELGRFIAVLEEACGREAVKHYEDMQPGDVVETYADITESTRDLGFRPATPIEEGLPRFVAWYRDYHGL